MKNLSLEKSELKFTEMGKLPIVKIFNGVVINDVAILSLPRDESQQFKLTKRDSGGYGYRRIIPCWIEKPFNTNNGFLVMYGTAELKHTIFRERYGLESELVMQKPGGGEFNESLLLKKQIHIDIGREFLREHIKSIKSHIQNLEFIMNG